MTAVLSGGLIRILIPEDNENAYMQPAYGVPVEGQTIYFKGKRVVRLVEWTEHNGVLTARVRLSNDRSGKR